MAIARMEKVEEFLTCTICMDEYTDPCTLCCQHTFCRKCVTQYTKTRPETLKSETIPCPSCRQVTKVPNPARPVEEWAWQIKPSIIILGLIDTSLPGHTSTETGRCCNVCEKIGETTPATSWCHQCEVALCNRCTRTHHATPSSHDNDVCDLSARVKVRSRKVKCREHKDEYIKFHCKDCKQSACHTCCVIHQWACKSVVTIESLKPEMKKLLAENRCIMAKIQEAKSMKLEMKKNSISEASKTKMTIKSQIQYVSQKAIDKFKQKEKQLMDKLDEVTDKYVRQLQSDVKTEEIEMEMYRQQCEFIDQAVDSDCLMDMYSMYQACQSGALVLGDVGEKDTSGGQQISIVRYSTDLSRIQHLLDDLQLGDIDLDYLDVSSPLSYPVLTDTTDVTTENDQNEAILFDVTVLHVHGEQTTVVTDYGNKCVISLYTLNSQAGHSKLPVDDFPWGITQLKENLVMVAVPVSREILTIKVTPTLMMVSTIKTLKPYFSLSVLKPSSTLAASSCSNVSVDILTIKGEILKSISHHNNMRLFESPLCLCVNNKGHILVSDKGKKSVMCLTSEGAVVWKYSPTGDRKLNYPFGITTTSSGRILLADRSKVIELNETGEYVRDVLTSQNGVAEPVGLTVDRHDSLFVCSDRILQKFTFV